MTDLTKLTIVEALKGLKNKEFTSIELTKAYLSNMEQGRKYNAYVLETPDLALQAAAESDKRYQNGDTRALEGIPLGIKDLFCTKGVRSTACSHILDGFVPQYESTVTQNLLNGGAVFLGKLNMDEFAMGGSNETSFYGPVVNPWSKDEPLVAGGSS
ncbi:MAG: Asp-tRNA(Asn)/Glu-tRNA(Gln) amidotransferase subunit GatA, partial [Alphaproteobacteria bacterium]|nr:Asp-tRNA(Asn)/Glu-tRNA(Gln) amidotransferase subunit GatA [Alphaproteobacteria bacterium]